MMESFSHAPTLQKQPVTDAQVLLMDTPSYQGICKLVQNGKQEYFRHDSPPLVSHSPMSSIKPVGFGCMVPNQVAEQIDFPCKRKGMTSTGIITQPLETLPNKRASQFMPPFIVPGIRESESPTTQAFSMSSSKAMPFSITNKAKKAGQTKPYVSKFRADPITNQSVETSSKITAESVDVVRSKLRDSLASSFALVSPTTEKLFSDGESSQSKPEILMAHGNQASGSHSSERPCGDFFSIDSSTTTGKSLNGDDILISNDRESKFDTIVSCKQDSLDGQWDSIFHRDGNIMADHFIVKDDLLQGNGLTWAFEIDRNMEEVTESQDSINGQPLVPSNPKFICPKKLASEIEMELFNLFGGVTKKYKEKGRSLLFNLKDHSNPDLREKVVLGEISPKKLCSMTAEELASKELSQWRIAKAEELSQMVVLPDVDMDVRRMVKKTHKGEVQVEVEDDDVSVEVSLMGGSQTTREDEYKTVKSGGDTQAIKSNIGDPDNMNNDMSEPHVLPDYHPVESDMMLQLMVDEMKDNESFLPDSYIDQLVDFTDFDQPFCDLPVDSDMDIIVANQDQKGSVKLFKDGQCEGKTDGSTDLGSCVLSVGSSNLKKYSGRLIWEGSLQLTVSVVSEFAAVFRRGEMTSCEEWDSPLEVKGRVKMEAFKKFMGELPKSRTRAVMVADFVLKDGTDEDVISEVVESYVCDERLGLAEPAPGVEVYLFPPKKEIMREILELEEDVVVSPSSPPYSPPSMIGVVVWRRKTQDTTNKNRRHHTSRRQQQQCGGSSSNTSCSSGRGRGFHSYNHCSHKMSKPVSDEDDVDGDDEEEEEEVPPGFGPRDEDLPEFNFASSDTANAPTLLHPFPLPPPSKPIHHMRELVHKYGFSTRPQVQPGRDYDDDIPEWQPHVLRSLPPHH